VIVNIFQEHLLLFCLVYSAQVPAMHPAFLVYEFSARQGQIKTGIDDNLKGQ
jgi:hypothetical protein